PSRGGAQARSQGDLHHRLCLQGAGDAIRAAGKPHAAEALPHGRGAAGDQAAPRRRLARRHASRQKEGTRPLGGWAGSLAALPRRRGMLPRAYGESCYLAIAPWPFWAIMAGSGKGPWPVARSAAWVRFETWRRLMICFTCALTVLSDIESASAMSLFDLPCEMSASTSR